MESAKPSEGMVPDQKLNRRSLIAAGACFAGMTPAAFAKELKRARTSGRPLFTQAALNAMIPPPSDPRHGPFLLDAAKDIRGFVRAHFTLTAQQEAELIAIPETDVANLQALLRSAAARRSVVQIEMGTSSSSSPSRRRESDERPPYRGGKFDPKVSAIATNGAREEVTLRLNAAATTAIPGQPIASPH